MNLRLSAWLLVVLTFLAGCLGSGAPAPAVVTGKVTLAGAPLAAGSVLFMTEQGQAATGPISADGTYTVQCPPGKFKVAVTPPSPVDPLTLPPGTAAAPSPLPPIPRKYQDLGGSGLEFEVQPGSNMFDIALTR